MSPHAAQHATLIFVSVFGGAAIWFGGMIAAQKWRGEVYYPREGNVWGAAIGIPTVIFVVLVLSFWR